MISQGKAGGSKAMDIEVITTGKVMVGKSPDPKRR